MRAIIDKLFVSNNGPRSVLVIRTSDPMICVASMVRDVATLVGNLLQVMPRCFGPLVVISVINVSLIFVVGNLENLSDAFRARVGIWRWAAHVVGDMAVSVSNLIHIPVLI